MFRTAILRSAVRASAAVRPAVARSVVAPRMNFVVAAPRVALWSRGYAAAAGLQRQEVEDRIKALLQGFDKVSPAGRSAMGGMMLEMLTGRDYENRSRTHPRSPRHHTSPTTSASTRSTPSRSSWPSRRSSASRSRIRMPIPSTAVCDTRDNFLSWMGGGRNRLANFSCDHSRQGRRVHLQPA